MPIKDLVFSPLGLFFGFLAFIAVGSVWRDRSLRRQRQSWPTVLGHVEGGGWTETGYVKRGRRYVDQWRIHVLYSFHVGGEYYGGEHVIVSYNYDEAGLIEQKYPKGATVEIKYNPKNPTKAFIAQPVAPAVAAVPAN